MSSILKSSVLSAMLILVVAAVSPAYSIGSSESIYLQLHTYFEEVVESASDLAEFQLHYSEYVCNVPQSAYERVLSSATYLDPNDFQQYTYSRRYPNFTFLQEGAPEFYSGLLDSLIRVALVESISVFQVPLSSTYFATENNYLLDNCYIVKVDTSLTLAISELEEIFDPAILDISVDGYDNTHIGKHYNYSLSNISNGSFVRAYSLRGKWTSYYTCFQPFSLPLEEVDFLTEHNGLTYLGSDSILSVEIASLLTETAEVNSRQFSTVALFTEPIDDFLWGSSSDSTTLRQASFVRKQVIGFSLSDAWEDWRIPADFDFRLDTEFNHNLPPQLVSRALINFESIEEITQDTLLLSRDAFVFFTPDTTFLDIVYRKGAATWFPIVGPCLDSLVSGSTPRLVDLGFAAAEIGMIYAGPMMYRYFSQTGIGSYFDDLILRLKYGRSAFESIDNAARTQTLRNRLIAEGLDPDLASWQAHHIVPLSDDAAREARVVLVRAGIGLDDVANGVGLSTEFHRLLNNNQYCRAVVERVTNGYQTSGSQGVLDALDILRWELEHDLLPF